MKDKKTPLYTLSCAVCRHNNAQLFYSQVIMYQLLIPFVSDQLVSFSCQYAPLSVDDLILDIRRYLVFIYEHPCADSAVEEPRSFSMMHRYIYDNLATQDSGLSMPPYAGDSAMLSVTKLLGSGSMGANISHIINNQRTLPKKLKKMLQSEKGYVPLLYRCFWLLQYYFVYYFRNICSVSSTKRPISHAASQFIEYFSLTDEKSACIFDALSEHCSEYSSFFKDQKPGKIDLLSLSRIILDIINEHANLRNHIRLDLITDASVFIQDSVDTRVPELEQYMEFQQYINAFGQNSYERYNMLLKFAPTNCYAADELARMYYWGKTFWIRKDNYFELEQNYEKAAHWYLKAIQSSNPPLQCACWSLSCTLTDIHYDTEDERIEAERKAIEYLHLAGEYPAAYNRLAWFLFRDAEVLYKKWDGNPSVYEDILVQFLSAIRLADRAGSMHWIYGNNQIAEFLMRHAEDDRLLSDLKKRLHLQIPFDTESQLKHAADYHNPWALRQLALYYIQQNKRPEARQLLAEAMHVNYSAAFYETAKYFCKTGSEKWRYLMNKASSLSYPLATYELASVETDMNELERLITLCRQQIFSEKWIDTALLANINTLAENRFY